MKKLLPALFIITLLYAFANEDSGSCQPLQTRCSRIKLKKGCADKSKTYFQSLMMQKDELVALFEKQGVYVEAVFLDHIGEDDYLIYFMKEENSQKSVQISSESTHPISKKHCEYKKTCWDERVLLESLLDFDRIPR